MSKQNLEVAILKSYPHHNMLGYCENRPKYRQGRKLTAIKVYTVNDESQHLLIRGVPSVNLHDEVEKLCKRYGNVLSIRQVQFEDQEEFTHSFHVIFVQIQSARFAKKQMDTKNFFGGILHVCYAPELESIEQTRSKLQMRITEVKKHINKIGLDHTYKKETPSQLLQHDLSTSSHDLMLQSCSSTTQKQNRWLEGGLQCSYIIPKPDPLNTKKETTKNKSNIKDSTPLDSNMLKFVPRQLHITPPASKIKKPNRIIFH
ncbi:RNA-binding protein 48 [Aphis craccivora]|uniref:RNA-binding protein 48 n=1 Tax=Aphis craccivora TaxID=307492 RepID=A0A6G0Z9R5_APHCR|nr:RNA-binding protein 48 [Aphis craccivora]